MKTQDSRKGGADRLRLGTPAALRDRRFRDLFDSASLGVAIADLDGRFVDANPACLEMVGYSLDEFCDLDMITIAHPEDRGYNQEKLQALLAGEIRAFSVEKRYLTRSGGIIGGRAWVSVIRDEAGTPVHLGAIVQNTMDARVGRDELAWASELQRVAGSLAHVGGWSLDAATMQARLSPEMYSILEIPPGQELPCEAALEMVAPRDREAGQVALQACLTDGTPFDLELHMQAMSGRRFPIRAIGEPRRDAEGHVVGVVGAFQDITELRAATEEAQKAVGNLTTTLESMTDAFLTVDRDWRLTFLNDRAAQLLRCDRAKVVGESLWEVLPEAVDTEVYDAYRGAVRYGRTLRIEEYYYPPLDTWLSLTAYPSEQGLAIYFHDVTEDRRVRQERQEREAALQRQAALLDEAQDAILVRDLNGTITFWNRGAERIYGWSSDDAVGRDVRGLLYDDPTEFDRATAQVLELGAWTGQLSQCTRADERVTAAGRWSLLRDDRGEPEAVLSIDTDVTKWQKIEQQLLHAQRMESIGFLASGVAHDLNNILAPILLACDLLRDVADDQEQVVEFVEMIAASASRGANLVDQVLSFARGMEGQRRPVDITSLLNDIATIVRDTFPKHIDLVLDIPDRVPGLVGDSTQIQQVLLNLAVNARDAMPEGGTLTIRAFEVALDVQYVAATPEVFPGDYLVVEVEDTGTGMPPEVRERIFEPFFTTKPQGAGTGLGLSTSQTIATSHGGFLQVYSEFGRGSRFRLHLPLQPEDDTASEEVAPASPLPHGNGQMVLIVDDEDRIRMMASRTLKTHGYQTLEAVNGAEAVSKFAQFRTVIDVIVVDMMMPVMDGPATIHALRSIDPDVRIIGASGLHGDGKVTQATTASVRHFLPKPYTARSLLETLHAILEV